MWKVHVVNVICIGDEINCAICTSAIFIFFDQAISAFDTLSLANFEHFQKAWTAGRKPVNLHSQVDVEDTPTPAVSVTSQENSCSFPVQESPSIQNLGYSYTASFVFLWPQGSSEQRKKFP